jgi:PadR family transcriptional regulator PadR
MTERAFLGEFEHLVLATALRLRSGYGAELVRELEERTGRQVQGGALYVTLDRLEQKGYLVSRMGEPDSRRGGRPRRFVEVTPAGVRALAEHRDALLRVWEGLEGALDLGDA